jgi:hypothetical protein
MRAVPAPLGPDPILATDASIGFKTVNAHPETISDTVSFDGAGDLSHAVSSP